VRSFTDRTDNRRAVYLNLVSSIEAQLREAYERRQEQGQETRADLARKLGVHRSVVTRRLTGGQNMTIESIADMVWALGHCIRVDIFDPQARQTNEVLVVPDHEAGQARAVQKGRFSREESARSGNSEPRGGARVRLSAEGFQKRIAQPCQ